MFISPLDLKKLDFPHYIHLHLWLVLYPHWISIEASGTPSLTETPSGRLAGAAGDVACPQRLGGTEPGGSHGRGIPDFVTLQVLP